MADTNSPSPPAKTESKEGRNTKTIIGCFFVGVIGIFLLLGIMTPGHGVSERGRHIQDISNVKELVTFCKIYALDWDGKFPEKLWDLYPEYIGYEGPFKVHYDKTGRFENYIYFTGRTTEKDDKNMPLVASPIVRKGKRVVGFSGGHVKVLKESEYQKLIRSAGKSP